METEDVMINHRVLYENIEYIHPDLKIAAEEYELEMNSKMFHAPTVFEDFAWIRVISGSLSFELLGEDIEVHAGETLFINSRQPHMFKGSSTSSAKYRVLTARPDAFSNPLLNRQLQSMIMDDRFAYTIIRPVSPLFSADMDAIFDLKKHKPQAYEFEIAARYFTMLRQIYRIYHHANPDDTIKHNIDLDTVREMLAYVGENFTDEISIDDIAAAGKISRSKCTRLFRTYLDQSPVEYIQNYRLERSLYLLRATDLQFAEIASRCGFNQQSYFNRLFIRKFGITPKQMRQKYTDKKQ